MKKKHIIGYTENGEYYMDLGEGLILGIIIGILITLILN